MSTTAVVCCQIEVPATGRSLVQRSPTECDVSECDRGSSKRRPRPARGYRAKKNIRTEITTCTFLSKCMIFRTAVSLRMASPRKKPVALLDI